MRMLHYVEEEESLVNNMPRILVEGSMFDMCKIIRNDSRNVQEALSALKNL